MEAHAVIHLRSYARTFSLVCYSVSHRCFLLFFFNYYYYYYYYYYYFVFAFVFVFFFFCLVCLFLLIKKERRANEKFERAGNCTQIMRAYVFPLYGCHLNHREYSEHYSLISSWLD